MMEMTRTDPEWKDKIITGDETWVYGYGPETKPQTAEWRDIAPNDFFLFPKLKAVLKGRHFDTRDDIIEKSPLALKSIPKEAYKNCFDNWEKRWRCNPMRQRSWGLLGQFPKRKPSPNRLGKKAMLCVWWDQTGVVYFKLLKPGETVNTSRYEQQMHSLIEALNEKRPELREKHNKLILQHDNAPAHNATVVKNTIKDLGWELLPHPPYSPDLAPSDYHLFTSLGHALKNQEFSNSDILRKWLVDWFDSKGIEFFRQGIRKLPERWSECIANQGNYFE
ncbi:hypothetical protein LAZ67_11002237 [Cordylochernes scorpioides]|uniref:Transposase n=1 Tax=Cordylochernes scorpioides TaxID=51811 RepID=A0ABY6KZ34_9ARAC|nr:hypothetical protein LAZ67_11002237 [Cordylochernes scorpioides]